MCGIAGVFHRDGRRPDERTLRAMAAALAHRGPDGEGVAAFDGCGLAHRRLSIIDLSIAAAQPMATEDRRFWIAFNGEIYNFRELRAELEKKGRRFRSAGDSEVALQLVAEEGPDAIAKLDGMFALAVWDDREKTLLLARDRTGKKPLFVYDDGRTIAFASEPKGIWAHGGLDASIREDSIPLYLSYGYVPTPDSMWSRVSKLPPGSWQLFTRERVEAPRTYWRFPSGPADQGVRAEDAALRVRELLTEAVKKRLVSDVPLGAFLSGGVDSTIVVGLMSTLMPSKVKTFSIGFEGAPEYDETKWARLVAGRFGTEHTEFRVTPENFLAIETLARHYDEPFGDSSAIPTWIVSKLTREKVTVALTGDGGDELFAGYTRFWAARLSERIPVPLGRAMAAASLAVPRGAEYKSLRNRARRFLAAAGEPLADRMRAWTGFFVGDELDGLLGRPADRAAIRASCAHALEEAAGDDLLNRVLHMNARTYLLDDLNVKVDRASMAASLEPRAPFLDTALIDYVFGLPGEMKLRGRESKWILKQAFRDLLPPEIASRPKMGFAVPLGAWFRGELASWLRDRLLDPGAKIYPRLDRAFVLRMAGEHADGTRDWGGHFWVLAMLELWLASQAVR